MSADEIAALSLTDVAAKIAAKELSAVEATEAALDRIARHGDTLNCCLLYTSPSPRDRQKSRMPSSA